jgi:hypothetical protein
MKIRILKAAMTHNEQEGYLGHVSFEVEGHKTPYELTLQSDRRPDNWNYALNFLNEPGSEEEIEAVERAIEDDDDIFDTLAEAAVEQIAQA